MATGLVDELPDVAGLRDRWGRDVLHCPYCHGWEVRDQSIGVLGGGPISVHQALLFQQWSEDVTFFSHTGAPDGEQAEQLAARGVEVIAGAVAAPRSPGSGPRATSPTRPPKSVPPRRWGPSRRRRSTPTSSPRRPDERSPPTGTGIGPSGSLRAGAG